MAHAYVGSSGWNYRDWRGGFYPEDLGPKKWLSFYATRFDSVEINYTFYRLPSKESCTAWYKQTPADFRFVVKASRYITHIKRLRDVHKAWSGFLGSARALEDKLCAVLLQFPSNFRASEANLQSVDEFLEYAVHRDSPRLAMEFRDRSCFGKEMLAILRRILRRYRVALVISHSSKYTVPEITATSDFAYFRFHGPQKMFASGYSGAELRSWAKQINALLDKGCDVHAYFNNDSGGHAPRDAHTLVQNLQSAEAPQHASQ